MFPIMPSTKIAQIVPLRHKKATRGLDKKYFKVHLNHWSKFKIISQTYSLLCLLQKLHSGSAPLNKRAARALDKKSVNIIFWTTGPNSK